MLQLCLAHQVHRQGIGDAQRIEALLAADPAPEHLGVGQEGHCHRHLRHRLGGRGADIGAGSGTHGCEASVPALPGQRAASDLADRDVVHEVVHGGAPPASGLHVGDGVAREEVVLHQEPHDGHHGEAAVVALRGLLPVQLCVVDALQELGALAEVGEAHATLARLDEQLVRADEGHQLTPALNWQACQGAEAALVALAAREAEHLGEDVPYHGNHGNSAVLDLRRRVAFQLRVSAAQVQRVPLLPVAAQGPAEAGNQLLLAEPVVLRGAHAAAQADGSGGAALAAHYGRAWLVGPCDSTLQLPPFVAPGHCPLAAALA
mmetsp:Transcript_38645/g.62356  ORF Transcript_38645/g.62356 Transcript_38645/m.62356 type:complete len:319 (+) Transcript_38645:526-1482(+)